MIFIMQKIDNKRQGIILIFLILILWGFYVGEVFVEGLYSKSMFFTVPILAFLAVQSLTRK